MSTTPEWVSGIGTILAFAVTLVALLREMGMRRQSEYEDEIRQARLVLIGEPFVGPAEDGKGFAVVVHVYNYSEQLIHEVVASVSFGPDPDNRRARALEHQFLGPGEIATFEFPLDDPTSSRCISDPEVWFLDGAGRRWRRKAIAHEPQRVFNYVPVGLESVAEQMLEVSRHYRRLRARISRLQDRRRRRVAAAQPQGPGLPSPETLGYLG